MPRKDLEARREYQREYHRKRRANDPTYADYTRQQCKNWYDKKFKSDPKYKTQRYKQRVLNKYGITVEQYDEMVEQQMGRCAICKLVEHIDEPGKRLHVDHCHETGAVRGLLCSKCNTGVMRSGVTPEILRRAAEYLEKSYEST